MAEKVYKFVGGALTEIATRDPAHRYRYTTVSGANAYVEFTDAEETARTAEEALPVIYPGPGRVVATRASQSLANNTATPIDFDTEVIDLGDYHSTGVNPDRFTVPATQAGLYAIAAHLKFSESSAAGGGVANAGDRGAQIRQGGAPLVSQRQRASAASDTEITISCEVDLAAGDVVRIGAVQNCGGTMNVAARMTMRRVG